MQLGIQEKCLIGGKQSRHKHQECTGMYFLKLVGCAAILQYACIYTSYHVLQYHKCTVTLNPTAGTDYHIKR